MVMVMVHEYAYAFDVHVHAPLRPRVHCEVQGGARTPVNAWVSEIWYSVVATIQDKNSRLELKYVCYLESDFHFTVSSQFKSSSD